jgi:hypothetical protein
MQKKCNLCKFKQQETALQYACKQNASSTLQAPTNIKGQSKMTANQAPIPVKFCKRCNCETVRLPNSNNRCKPCSHATNKAYQAANPEKVRAGDAEYRKTHPEKIRKKNAKWKKNHPNYRDSSRKPTISIVG